MIRGAISPVDRPVALAASSAEATRESDASARSRLAELLILCARIGFNP